MNQNKSSNKISELLGLPDVSNIHYVKYPTRLNYACFNTNSVRVMKLLFACIAKSIYEGYRRFNVITNKDLMYIYKLRPEDVRVLMYKDSLETLSSLIVIPGRSNYPLELISKDLNVFTKLEKERGKLTYEFNEQFFKMFQVKSRYVNVSLERIYRLKSYHALRMYPIIRYFLKLGADEIEFSSETFRIMFREHSYSTWKIKRVIKNALLELKEVGLINDFFISMNFGTDIRILINDKATKVKMKLNYDKEEYIIKTKCLPVPNYDWKRKQKIREKLNNQEDTNIEITTSQQDSNDTTETKPIVKSISPIDETSQVKIEDNQSKERLYGEGLRKGEAERLRKEMPELVADIWDLIAQHLGLNNRHDLIIDNIPEPKSLSKETLEKVIYLFNEIPPEYKFAYPYFAYMYGSIVIQQAHEQASEIVNTAIDNAKQTIQDIYSELKDIVKNGIDRTVIEESETEFTAQSIITYMKAVGKSQEEIDNFMKENFPNYVGLTIKERPKFITFDHIQPILSKYKDELKMHTAHSGKPELIVSLIKKMWKSYKAFLSQNELSTDVEGEDVALYLLEEKYLKIFRGNIPNRVRKAYYRLKKDFRPIGFGITDDDWTFYNQPWNFTV